MKVVELKRWMKENDVSAVDIASGLKMHPNTILKYLRGAPARRSTVAAIQQYITLYSVNQQQTGGLKATGT